MLPCNCSKNDQQTWPSDNCLRCAASPRHQRSLHSQIDQPRPCRIAKLLRQRFTSRSSLLTIQSGTVCPRESAVLGTRRSPIPSPGQGRTQDRHQAGREDPTDGPVTSNTPWISRRRGRSSHGHFCEACRRFSQASVFRTVKSRGALSYNLNPALP